MRYFVEFHFGQVQDAFAISMRELRERYWAAIGIVYGEPETSDEERRIDEMADELRRLTSGR